MRIPYLQLKAEFKQILLSLSFTDNKAEECAAIFANNSRDGVVSHGLNRFPVFVQYVKEGLVIPDAEPSIVNSFGAIEQWNGNLAPGTLNATFCTNRAIALAKANGIGCVAIKNTNTGCAAAPTVCRRPKLVTCVSVFLTPKLTCRPGAVPSPGWVIIRW